LIKRADQTIDTEQIAEHWDRMGNSTPRHVTASVALKRLVGFSAKNRKAAVHLAQLLNAIQSEQ
jgi:hypothetical protein